MKLLWAFCLSFFVLLAKAQTEVHVYLLEECPMAQFYGPTFRKQKVIFQMFVLKGSKVSRGHF